MHKMFDNPESYVKQLVAKHGVPAASLAVWEGGNLRRVAYGVLNVNTGVEATVDSIFQIGSIGKLFTASLVMLLVDQGRVTLDAPVKQYLPSFHVADPVATETITLRHLLAHSSGLISDISFEKDVLGEGNAISRYVDRCYLLGQVHAQRGQRYSYANTGFVIAGRVVESVLGIPWRQAVEELIFAPLNMTHSVARPPEVLRFRAAIGHFQSDNPSDPPASVTPNSYLPFGLAPAGSVLTMSASDLLKFGRAHLTNGSTDSGHRWMSEASAKSMREAQVALPATAFFGENRWGIGWGLLEEAEFQGVVHAGGTSGQQALLVVIPEQQSVLALQVNGMRLGGAPALQQVFADFRFAITGTRPVRTPPLARHVEIAPLVGTYGQSGMRYEMTESGGTLYGKMVMEGSASFPVTTCRLVPLGELRFAAYSPGGDHMEDVVLLEPDERGRPRYLFASARLYAREESRP